MKRLSIILAFVLLTMSVVAQQRMNFLGQPLGCSLSTFKQRMAAKGYKYKGEIETNIHYFDGVFGGDDVTVGAIVTPKSKTVVEVAVVYTNLSSYSKSTLEYKRELLETSFINKYGNYIDKNDVYTEWDFDYGFIMLKFNSDKTPHLTIWYDDNLGEELYEREQESDY